MDHKEMLDDIYRTLASLDDLLRTSEQSDGTKMYWVGRAITEMAGNLRPVCDPKFD